MTTITAALRMPGQAGVALTGPAGTGKTELMRNTLARLARADRSYKVLPTMTCTAGPPTPFGAVHRILPRPPAEEPPMWNPVQRAAEALKATAAGRTLVVSVDDAHLLDDLSMLLIAELSRSGAARVVVSIRDGERAPEPLTALWQERVLERIDVHPLSDAEMEAALAKALDGQIERTTMARLQGAARGNPLLLRELVESGQAEGTLTDSEGVWLWRGPWKASPRLRELIRARVARLDADQRHALELLAFAGVLGLSLLARLTSPVAIERLERSGLVQIDRDGDRVQVRLGHPLHGDIVHATLPVTRARARQAELADAIEAYGARRGDDALHVALWRLESGTPATRESLLAAARQAWGGYDVRLTRRLAKAAIAAGSVEAVPLLGDLLLFSGGPGEAEAFYAAPPACADRHGRVRLDFVRGVNLLWAHDRVDDGLALLAAAAPAMLASSWRDDLGPTYVAWLAYVGRCEAALRLSRELAELPGLSAAGETVRLAAHSMVTAFTGRNVEGSQAARRALDRMDDHVATYPWLRGIPTLGAVYALQFAGDLRGADLAARHWHDTMTGNPTAWPYATTLSSLALGRSARLLGRARSSVSHLRDARRLWAEQETNVLAHVGAAELAHSLALLGDLDGARRLLQEARARPLDAFALFNFSLDAAASAVAAAEGDIGGAVAVSLRAAGRAGEMGAHSWELCLLHDVVRLGEPGAALDRLAELAGTADGPLPPLFARHAAALAGRDAAGLDAVAAGFARLGAHLTAAEAASQAAGAHRERGMKDSAGRSSWHAAEWTALCEDARTPALDLSLAPVLTRREHQIALRAARGETNPQIATALGIAARTVGNHLSHSYDKLGISGRAELPGLFRDHGGHHGPAPR